MTPELMAVRYGGESRFAELENKLQDKDFRIGFAHCRDITRVATKSTKYGEFLIGSPLSYQLAVVESSIKVLTNIEKIDHSLYSVHAFTKVAKYRLAVDIALRI